MMELRFLWSAMCSASVTKATGANSTKMFSTLLIPLNWEAPSLNMPVKVNSGTWIRPMPSKADRLMICSAAQPVALPMKVSTRPTA